MYGYHQTVFSRIFRHYKGFNGNINIGAICRNSENTAGVFTAGSTDCIYKGLVPLIKAPVLLATVVSVGTPAPATVVDFIESLEHQEFSLVLEPLSDLSPHCRDLIQNLLVFLRIYTSRLDIEPILAVCTIVMHIDNSIQSGRFSITHDFRHSFKPSLVNLIVRSLANMSKPCHRDTYCGETSSLQLIECSLSSLGIAPECFTRDTIIICIEMISEVPAQTEPFSKLPGQIAIIFRDNGISTIISASISTITRWHRSLGLQDIQVLLLFSSHDSKSGLTLFWQYILFYSHCHNCLVVYSSSFPCLYPVFLRYEIELFRCSHCKSLLATFVGKLNKSLVDGQRDFFNRLGCFLTTSHGQKQ